MTIYKYTFIYLYSSGAFLQLRSNCVFWTSLNGSVRWPGLAGPSDFTVEKKKTFVCRCFYHHHFYYLKEQIFLNIYLLTSLLVVILELLYLSNRLVEMARWTPHLGKTYRGRQWAVVEGYLHPNCSLERLSNTRSINQEGISIHVSLTAKLSRVLPI